MKEYKLKNISTDDLHFVKVPENHIVIDSDTKGQDGQMRNGRHDVYEYFVEEENNE